MCRSPVVKLPWFSSSGHPHNVSEPAEPPVPNKCRDGLDTSSLQHLLVADTFKPLDTQDFPQTPLMKGLNAPVLGLSRSPGLTPVQEHRKHSSSVDSDLSVGSDVSIEPHSTELTEGPMSFPYPRFELLVQDAVSRYY